MSGKLSNSKNTIRPYKGNNKGKTTMSRKTAIFWFKKNIKLSSIFLKKEPHINEKKTQDLENLHFIVSAIRSMFLDEVECLPTWAACRSLVSKAQTPLIHVGFLPYLPYPVTKYSTVCTTLCNFVKIQTQLNQSSPPVICDEGVLCIVTVIVLQRPEQFKCLIPMLGGFHMAKAP